MMSWWWLWIAFMFLFLLPPVGYGWGYRRWGPPYPRYIQRRRQQRSAGSGEVAEFDHQSWGWGGDLMWMIFLVWMFWAMAAFWWH
jgi:hypothetical protein